MWQIELPYWWDHAQMTSHELHAALRAEGCAGLEEVRFAVLENNGRITVVRRERPNNHPIGED